MIASQAVIDAARGAQAARDDGRTQGRRAFELVGRIDRRLCAETRSRTCRPQARDLRLPLVGEFQIENALVAAGLAIGTGSDPDQVFAALEHLEGAKGRLERVGERNGAPIFVDYAHKPDALAKALQALRPYAKRKLVVVFGAGGDRDAGKRPLMGEIASRECRQRHRHRRQSAQRKSGRDPIGDPERREGRQGDRRPRRGDPDRDIGPAARRCAADRRQGPRNRTDRRRPHAAVQRSRGRGGGAGVEGGMSAPLWTSSDMAEAMRATVSGALPRGDHPAFPSTAAPSRPAKPISRSRATCMTAMILSRRH